MNTKYIAQGALIAAVYAFLTYAVAPITSGLVQCRISEALCVLPFFTPAAIPGLFLGCLMANLLMGAVVYDILFGSLATLLAALAAWWIGRNVPGRAGKLLAPLPAVLINALVVGYLLAHVYEVGVSMPLCALYVALGQFAACYVLGVPLMALIEKYRFFERF